MHIFTRFDLIKCYSQITLEESNIPKVAITIPFGLFELSWMTFDLTNVDQYFQSLIDDVLSVLSFAYINNVFIASKDIDEDLEHLQLVLKACSILD